MTRQATAKRGPFKVPGLSGEIAEGGNSRSAAEQTSPAGEVFGYYVICHQYFDRYHLPVMHTETNRKDADAAPAWLWKEWSNILRLKHDGVPIVGFTWFSLIDQIDWDTALREDNHRINPLGLFDLKRRIRPVGKAYRELIRDWRDRMPMESVFPRAAEA
jgi:beta-glucosidase/6-phospho-beta-glucosidase/beta-galactosidase